MIDIRLSCENCDKSLPPNSTEAMFCAFECTFCQDCVADILHNVCPNCGGGFENRPILPKRYLEKNPPRQDKVYKPVNMEKFKKRLEENREVLPSER